MKPKFSITLNADVNFPNKDGEPLPIYAHNIITQLLAQSVERQIALPFIEKNQQAIAEEIGYRKALMEFASFFQESI